MENSNAEKELTYKHPFSITNARYDFTLIESRILVIMLYLADKYMTIGPSADKYGEIYDGEYGSKVLKLPIPTILGDEYGQNQSRNYQYVREAMESFNQKQISIYVSNDQWRTMPPFALIEKKAGEGHVTATIAAQTWKLISALSTRFTCIRIDNMLLMKSKYTIRMHQLVESLAKPVTYKIDTLKKMFKLEDKYKENNDFFKYVLNVSQSELDKLGLTSFEYEKKSLTEKKKKGRQPITHITIIPSYQEMLDDKAVRRLVKAKGLTSIMTEEEITILMHFGFRPEEITANAPAFFNFARLFDIKAEMRILEKDSENKENPKGWIISEVRRRLGLLDM